MEHLHHFQLSDDPFRSDPLEKYDVALPSQNEALARLDRGVRQGKGLLLLAGGVGAGKTRVARRLYEELEEEIFEAGMMLVMRSAVGSDWLLGRVAQQLGVETPERERDALLAQIYERLAIVHEDGRRAVLIIDDAHALANPDTLAEVCSLVKLEYEDRRLVSVVLVGGPPLAQAIASDPMLAHHVDVKVQLDGLDKEEALSYLAARVRAAGGDSQLLLPGASAALHELAEGCPGRLNVLADNALYEAWVAGRAQVTRADVERAHSDLGWDALGETLQAPPASPKPARPAPPVEAEVTDPILAGVLPGEESDADLDSELEAAFDGAAQAGVGSQTVVMDFDASPAPSPPPRVATAEPTEIQLEEPVPQAPPKKRESDDVDDLFMELLED